MKEWKLTVIKRESLVKELRSLGDGQAGRKIKNSRRIDMEECSKQ